jgi:HSP20 family protein
LRWSASWARKIITFSTPLLDRIDENREEDEMPHRNPFQGVTDLFSEFSRAREVGLHGRDLASEDRQRTHASAWVPTTDIFVQGDQLVIRIELAGVEPEDISLHFANGVLAVSGNRTGEFGGDEPTFYVRERFYGEFRRSITLPEGTRRDQIEAGFDDGLVEIVVKGVDTLADSSRIELRDRSSGRTTRSVG